MAKIFNTDYTKTPIVIIKSNNRVNSPEGYNTGWAIVEVKFSNPDIFVTFKHSGGKSWSKYGATHTGSWLSNWVLETV
ncbi:MAG: hypothetical protein ACRC4T_23750 [Cetobacterium sp.]